MADKHSDEQQQSEVKITSAFVWSVIWSFVVPVVLIILIATIVYTAYVRTPATENPALVADRIKPIGAVEVRDPSIPVALKSGEEVFKGLCISCHGAGLMGAPKNGDQSAWSRLVAQGEKTLFEHAIKGIRGMPPKGGNPDLDDIEVQRAVVYMVNQAGFAWKEPAAPAITSSTSTTTPVSEAAAPSSATAPTPEVLPNTSAAKPSEQSVVKSIDGKAVFEASCAACHATGVAGAPKQADKAAWAPRLAKGKQVLYQNALQGIGIMPAKGGNPALSDDEVRSAVDYLAGLVQ